MVRLPAPAVNVPALWVKVPETLRAKAPLPSEPPVIDRLPVAVSASARV